MLYVSHAFLHRCYTNRFWMFIMNSNHCGMPTALGSTTCVISSPSLGQHRCGRPVPTFQEALTGGPDDQLWAEVCQRAREFWSTTYMSRAASLLIAGPSSIEHLEACADLFSTLKSFPLPAPASPFMTPWSEVEEGSVICAQTNGRKRSIQFQWAVPWSGTNHDFYPAFLLSFAVLTHSEGSVYSALVKRCWLEEMTAYANEGNSREGYGFMVITVSLTSEGWRNWRDVADYIFLYLALLGHRTLSQAVIDQCLHGQVLSYRPQELLTPEGVAQLATAMLKPYDQSRLLVEMRKIPDGDHGSRLSAWIRRYLAPQLARITLAANDGWDNVIPGAGDFAWKTSPSYGVRHRVFRLHEDSAQYTQYSPDAAESCGFRLPEPNPLLSWRTDRCAPERDDGEVVRLVRTEGRAVWFKQDLQRPEAFLMLDLQSPLISSTPRAQAITWVIVNSINEQLKITRHKATHAGIHVQLGVNANTLFIQLNGLPEFLSSLFETYLQALAAPPWDADAVVAGLASLPEVSSQWATVRGGEIWEDIIDSALCRHHFSAEEYAEAAEAVGVADLRAHHADLLHRLQARMFMFGNVDRAFVHRMYEICAKYLGHAGPEYQLPPPHELHPGWSFMVDYVQQPSEVDDQVKVYYMCNLGDAEDIKLHCTSAVLEFVAKQLFDDWVVTPYAIGYHWTLEVHEWRRHLWFVVIVSTAQDPAYVERRIERFLLQVQSIVCQLTQCTLDAYKADMLSRRQGQALFFDRTSHDALRAKLIEDTSLDPFAALQDYDMHCVLASITNADIAALIQSRLHPQSPSRMKLSVRFGPSQRLSKQAIDFLAAQMRSYNVPGGMIAKVQEREMTLQELADVFVDELGDYHGPLWRLQAKRAAEMYPPGPGSRWEEYFQLTSSHVDRMAFLEDMEDLKTSLESWACSTAESSQ